MMHKASDIQRTERSLWLACLLLIACEILFLAYHCMTLGWYGPVQDFWGSIEYIHRTLSHGQWLNSELWAFQNNHRLALPKLAFLIEYQFFKGSNQFLTALGLLLIFAQILILQQLLTGTTQADTAHAHGSQGNLKRRLAFLLASATLLLPNGLYNLLNTFNIQWIQCAFLGMAACYFFNRGLARQNHLEQHGVFSTQKREVFAGMLFAVLCCYTTFSLTAVFPALYWLLHRHQVAWPKKLCFLVTVIIFSSIFVWDALWIQALSEQRSTHPIDAMQLAQLPLALLLYLLNYLNPVTSGWLYLPFTLIALASLAFLIHSHFNLKKYPQQPALFFLQAAMIFVISLALTTALGRSMMGELSLGLRFHPIMILYWSCFIPYFVLACCTSPDNEQTKNSARKARMITTALLAILWMIFFNNAADLRKRMVEESNRFWMMQSAYLSGNTHEDALFESLVPEWRASSYPGIRAAVELLQKNRWGIYQHIPFNGDITAPAQAAENLPVCLNIQIAEKPRANSMSSKNIFIRRVEQSDSSADANMGEREETPYLLLYKNSVLTGVAKTQQQTNPLKNIQGTSKWHEKWIGTSSSSLLDGEISIIASQADGTTCRAIRQ